MPPAFNLKLLLIISLLASPYQLIAAESQGEQCHPPLPDILDQNMPADKLLINTDQLKIENQKIYSFEGNVEFITKQQVLNTESAKFDYLNKTLQAQGGISYQKPGLSIKGDSLELDVNNASGQAKQTFYKIAPTNANGFAENIEFKENRLRLNNADYTTCPPDKKAWQISAEEIILDQQKNEGVARHAKITLFSVPVMYLPYISFPLQGRKSGFLAPSPAYSSTDGFDITLPYYVNIAPNYDLTLNPRHIQKRGTQLGAEFRYLQPNYNGISGVEYMSADNRTKSDRYQFHFGQQNYLSDESWLGTDLTHVSDGKYYSDLGTSLSTANQSQINRNILFQSRGRYWYFSGLLNDYQMLNLQAEPYRRLPQLDFYWNKNINGVSSKFDSQYSYFYHSDNDKIHRLILNPSMSLPFIRKYGYLTPTAGVNARAYDNNDEQLTAHQWYFNTSGALFFDRETRYGKQTLEPRFSYLLMPHKIQTDLPLIDSDALILSYDELFQHRRYNGWDRFGDIHRLSGGIENQWFDLNGKPRFSLNLAIAQMLGQQQANFTNDTPLDKNDTIYAISAKTQINNKLKLAGDYLSISQLKNVEYMAFSTRYSQDTANQMELRYDFRSNLLEQTTFIYTRRIDSQWRLATRWSYSNNHQQIREGLAGLEYNNCCWSVRVVGRRYANVIGEEAKNAVALQFELKGLTAIGSRLEDTFSQEIFGIQ